MAGPTRLELATSGVTGRRSNQLNYDPTRGMELYCTRTVTGNVSDEGNGVPGPGCETHLQVPFIWDQNC